jgi:ATP-dependent RNA helicase DDX51/DBP6
LRSNPFQDDHGDILISLISKSMQDCSRSGTVFLLKKPESTLVSTLGGEDRQNLRFWATRCTRARNAQRHTESSYNLDTCSSDKLAMSSFYARYVPPPKKSATEIEPSAQLNGPTKRKRPEQELAVRDTKKQRSVTVAEVKKDDFGIKRFVPKKNNPRNAPEANPSAQSVSAQPATTQTDAGEDVLAKYKVTGTVKKANTEANIQLRRPVQKGTSEPKQQDIREPVKEPKPKKNRKRKGHKDDEEEATEPVKGSADATRLPEDGFEKHPAVRERFQKAKRQSEQHQDEHPSENMEEAPKPELHGLEPLPQPPVIEQPFEASSYSTLPSWLARADRVSRDTEVTFASLNLSETVLANLKAKGFDKAMPIQSAVVPLLSSGAKNYEGDLAVAAATGSGKTLAYVLPMVDALKELAVTKLRGLIVVPTRELVKQVQETFNMCAEGTNLRAATALGSKSVTEEAESLIESYELYDPDAYAEQQSKEVDWEVFSLVELFDRVKGGAKQVPNHVTKYRSKVDVLVCTPGRLVEHLQATKGFSLDNLQWLVIDEVDRLLNESYQEWLEVVMPALQSRRATESRDEVLLELGLDLPARQIRKVILSATMTQDLSKLNSLNLRNPRLLTLEGEQTENTNKADHAEEATEPIQDATGTFQLPSTLTETAVLVGDGSDKPLHLLELLRTQVAKAEKSLTNGTTPQDSNNSSSGSDSDSESDSSASSLPANTNGSKLTSPPSTYPSTLIFTRSTESAPRLSRLLSLLDPTLISKIAVLTRSTASSASSRKALKSFRTGALSILITTDRAARGLDIPDIKHVVNYDVPSSVQFYVHRVGRTARAGKIGKAWTLVAHREGRWFDGEIIKGEMVRRKGKVTKLTLEGVGEDKDVRRRYEEALRVLGEEVEGK